MTDWRIVALAPTEQVGGCNWRAAGDGAQAIAAAHGLAFELLLIGGAMPDGGGWQSLSRCTLARTSARLQSTAQFASVATALLADASPTTLIVVPPGPFGEDIAAQLAVSIGGTALGRASSILLYDAELRVTRAAFGGRGAITLRYPARPATVALRGVLSDVATTAMPAPSILDVEAPALDLAVARTAIAGRKTPLEGARLVVSGGRGLDETGFAMLEEIADALGGAVGGSLPAVDAGLVAVSRQVGQSGKFVTPALYVAVGLSGTPQHLAGIGAATRLVAINKDPRAPIFTYAELGAVADARDVLPLLRDLLVADTVPVR
jgi:electron transfer flavoprotein alpha subunit